MIVSSPSEGKEDDIIILTKLIENTFCNQLLLGDIHAPMNEISDIYKIIENDEIIGGWSVFRGFELPVIILPPTLPKAWNCIKEEVNLMDLSEILLIFPLECSDKSKGFPWDGWDQYKFNQQGIDLAMRFTIQKLEVSDISDLPPISAASSNDIKALKNFYDEITEFGDFNGFFHPLQLKSDNYVICKDGNDIIGTAGTHFETPYSVQLGNIYVKPKYRRKGIGKALTISVTLGAIKTQRVPTLFVNENNKAAINLYESIGFEKYEKFVFYRGLKF